MGLGGQMKLKFTKYDALMSLKGMKASPHQRNKHPETQIIRLAQIMKEHGVRHPIHISSLDGAICFGHGRREAALLNGWTEFPIVYQQFDSDEEYYTCVQSDNAIAAWSELDLSSINTDIGNLGPDYDIDLLGIKDFTLEPIEKFDPQSDEDSVPETPQDPITKLGDLYKLGNHRLLCGDSTSIDAVEKLMGGKKADMVFTDPPYNQETSGGEKGNIGSAFLKQSQEIQHMCDFNPHDFLQIIPCVFDIAIMNAFIFCNKDLVVDYLNWSKSSGFSSNILIWKKPNAIPIGGSYRPDIEYLLTFRKSAIWNGSLESVSYSKVLEFSREKNKIHPTMKPVEMIENQILISSYSKGIVVDLFGGFGSTLIACEKTNRKCFMMELDPKYIDVIISRWEKYTNKKAFLLNDDGTETPFQELKEKVQHE